jgi:hypothetical protein
MPDADSGVSGFEEGGRWLFNCGTHPVAQYPFYLDQNGLVHVYPDEIYPISASIEKYVESDAVLYEMYRNARSPLLPVGWRMVDEGVFAWDDRRPDGRVDLPIMPEATDGYTTWWGDRDIRIQRATYLEWGRGPRRHIVRTFARSWRKVWEVRDMFSGINFCYPDPFEGMEIV